MKEILSPNPNRRFPWLNLLLTIPLLLSTSPVNADSPPYNIEHDHVPTFVSGTYAAYLDDPIFYDTHLPIIFQFPIPKHMENALKILWEHATVCNNSDSRYEGKLCPVVHHLHKVVANLSADMGFWKDFYPTALPPTGDIFDKTDVPPTNLDCDKISPHFANYYTNQGQLKDYLKVLQKCPLGEGIAVLTQPESWLIDKSIYYTMVDRFYSEFYRTLPGTGNVDWVVTLNSYTAIQGVLLSNNYMESNRLMNAFMTCQAGKIPESFVKIPLFMDALKSLHGKVYASHFKYLWEKQADISGYYKLPIADCTFTDDFKFIVRVLVPLQRTDTDAKLLEIKTFPFLERLYSTEDPKSVLIKATNATKLCTLNSPGAIRMIQSDQGLLFESKCESNELCHRAGLDSYIPRDACTSAIVTNSEELVAKHCKVDCFPVNLKSLPLIQRKSPDDTFVLVGGSNQTVFITCDRQPLDKVFLRDLGALEIKLGCNCQISYGNQVFKPGVSCSSNRPTNVKHILPFQWEMRVSVPGKNVDSPVKNNGIDDSAEKEVELGHKDAYNHSEIESNHIPRDGEKADKQIYIEPTGTSSGFVVQFCLLWILIFGLVGSNLFLLYQVYYLIKWRKLQMYKDTRIVYSVPASPQFPNKF